ncbi:Protein argonaute 2 [Camellia lanceoleosa]|uniref:Protein argonaute 2 n=1 Tax=Camellia lanceoleosa TaxID=1840588 RepID=A0ACC0G5N5_9ERIC|nr:Protein argonaute 2 [Camellia lanceoleosa]
MAVIAAAEAETVVVEEEEGVKVVVEEEGLGLGVLLSRVRIKVVVVLTGHQYHCSKFKELKFSEKKPSSSIAGGSSEEKIVPIKRPDNGATLAFTNIWLLANHFPVKFNPQSIIMHYDVDIKPNMPPGSHAAKRPISKSDLRLITDKLFSSDLT